MDIKPSDKFSGQKEGIWKRLNLFISEAKSRGEISSISGLAVPTRNPHLYLSICYQNW